MGIIRVASGSSCWRGLEYYKNNKVDKFEKINENEYKSIVNGSNEKRRFNKRNH